MLSRPGAARAGQTARIDPESPAPDRNRDRGISGRSQRPRIPFQSTTLGEGDFVPIERPSTAHPPAPSRPTASIHPERPTPSPSMQNRPGARPHHKRPQGQDEAKETPEKSGTPGCGRGHVAGSTAEFSEIAPVPFEFAGHPARSTTTPVAPSHFQRPPRVPARRQSSACRPVSRRRRSGSSPPAGRG